MSKTIVFYACPAFVCQVLGLRRAKVWLDWPDEAPLNYDSTKTLELDLDKSPSFGKGVVEVDDVYTIIDDSSPGLTTLGPQWPQSYRDGVGHAFEAGVWLEESVWQKAKAKGLMQYPPRLPAEMPISSQLYRWQSLLVPTSQGGPLPARRYQGFHARLDALTGNQATFEVWPATEAPSSSNFKTRTVDLSNPNHVHAADVVTAAADRPWRLPRELGQQGPLFLGWELLGDLPFPKLPLGQMQ